MRLIWGDIKRQKKKKKKKKKRKEKKKARLPQSSDLPKGESNPFSNQWYTT